jgi:hypothetical protein
VQSVATNGQAGGNMEGKETRFGIAASSLFATVTTAASCGAVNGMHDSLTPIGGLVPLFNMEVGEVIFGGVGSGLYDEVNRNHILAALQHTSGVVDGPKGAARILNLHPNTLRHRMDKLGIKGSRHRPS